MESLKKNKILVTIFILSLISFLTYQFGGVFSTPISGVVEISPEDEAATAEILTLLSKMQQASINTELFTSTAWSSLVDYSVSLPTDVPGRPDLFGGNLQSASLPPQAAR